MSEVVGGYTMLAHTNTLLFWRVSWDDMRLARGGARGVAKDLETGDCPGTKVFSLPNVFLSKFYQVFFRDFRLAIFSQGGIMIPLMATQASVSSGHAEGDLVLRGIQGLAKQVVRRRFGGVEYA